MVKSLLLFIFQLFLVIAAGWVSITLITAIALLFMPDVTVLNIANNLLAQEIQRTQLAVMDHSAFTSLYLQNALNHANHFNAVLLSSFQSFDATHSVPWLHNLGSWLLVGLVLVKLMFLKTLMLPGILPVFALLGMTALIDGLVVRDLRTFGAGRESASMYYKSHGALEFLAYLAVFIALILPTSVAVALALSISFAVAVFVNARSFKKYV